MVLRLPRMGRFSNEIMSTYGLPEIHLTDDGNGLVNPPAELKEGYYLATVEQTEDLFIYVEFVQPPSGLTTDKMNEQFLAAARDDIVSDGWIFAGGSVSGYGANGTFIVHLTEGDWYIGGTQQKGEEEEVPALYPLHITAYDTDAAAPKATVNITMGEFSYTGIDKTLASGSQVWNLPTTAPNRTTSCSSKRRNSGRLTKSWNGRWRCTPARQPQTLRKS